MSKVRVRFAPSPTGYLHIGGLRTALYNYLLAKKTGGAFLLRIEDTDRTRFVADAEQDLVDSLRWAGLDFDEGPDVGGEYGPYRQSERSERYAAAAEKLLANGSAYVAFDTPAEIEAMRERLKSAENPSPRYDLATRMSMRNSLSMPADEVAELRASGAPEVVRLLVKPGATVGFEDAVRGRVEFASEVVDDQVLVKSDGMPTYHLANVVDDHDMAITHVIRGEEWLSSTPKHILLYEALGWSPPVMAHLPLILSPTGGKLSKRAAERQGIPVLVRQYREAGYEPEALINYLALLGWNPGDEREVFDLDGLTDAFSLDRVGSSGVQFSMDKLAWFNGQHLRLLDIEALSARVAPDLSEEPADRVEAMVSMMQDRVSFAHELVTQTGYFFQDPEEYEAVGVKKRWKPVSADLLAGYARALEVLEPFDVDSLESSLRSIAETRGVGAGQIIHPTRLALSGVTFGPSLFDLMVALGRDTCVRRMRRAVAVLG